MSFERAASEEDTVGTTWSKTQRERLRALDAEEVQIRQGYLEGSNVNAIREMILMVEALRSFEDHQKVIHSFDSIHQSAVNQIGRLR